MGSPNLSCSKEAEYILYIYIYIYIYIDVYIYTYIDGSILEQVKQFNSLGCELCLDGEPDFEKKIKDSKEYAHY